MTAFRRAAALCVLATAANLRSPLARAAAGAFVAIAALGQALARTAPGPVPDDDRLVGYAFLIGAILLLRSGLAEHRRCRLDELLRHNFLSPTAEAAGHAAALGAQLAVYSAFAFATTLALGAGDLRFAGWYAALLGLATALFLPAILLIEMVSDLRLPLALVGLVFVALVLGAEPTIGAERVIELLGLRTERYRWASLLPLGLRVALAVPAAFGVLVLVHAARHRPPR